LEIPLINVESLDENEIKDICEIFDKISDKNLDPFWDQLDQSFRYKLDLAIFKGLRVKIQRRRLESKVTIWISTYVRLNTKMEASKLHYQNPR